MEAEFRHHYGVIGTAVGYSGGHTTDPTYEQVCGHDTGHAESVLVEYDPAVISYDELLQVFWSLRDHTHRYRLGPERGDQYRSVVFCHSAAQKAQAEDAKKRSEAQLHHRLNVEIVSAGEFYKAEEYHQQFQEKGGAASCKLN